MSVEEKPGTILVVPISAVGHVNACIGSARPLLDKGYRVIFVVHNSFQGKLKPHGFEEHIYSTEVKEANPGEALAHGFLQNEIFGPSPIDIKLVQTIEFFVFSDESTRIITESNNATKQAIHLYNPDLIIVDSVYLIPAVYYSGKPWIKHISMAPTFYVREAEIPPSASGFPSNDTDRQHWTVFERYRDELFHSKRYNDLVQSLGYDRYPEDQVMPSSEAVTVYGYPDELNYHGIRCKDWFNLEVFNLSLHHSVTALEDIVPRTFLADSLRGRFSGKVVYLSLGSMGSVDLRLMRRLISALGGTAHKFIVSKGPCHEQYVLAHNMWGERYLPQTQLVPLVDAVITHGGNNTVTETFAHGKPMLVMPLFVDQFDNAQRLHESGLGARVDPYWFQPDHLVSVLNRLLYDQRLHARLSRASARIKAAPRTAQMVNIVQTVLSNVST